MAGEKFRFEGIVLEALDPKNDITLEELRNFAFFSVVMARERGVERLFFSEMLELFMEIVQREAVMSCGVHIYDTLRELEPKREPQTLKAGLDNSAAEINGLRVKLHEKLRLVLECPTTDDKIS